MNCSARRGLHSGDIVVAPGELEILSISAGQICRFGATSGGSPPPRTKRVADTKICQLTGWISRGQQDG